MSNIKTADGVCGLRAVYAGSVRVPGPAVIMYPDIGGLPPRVPRHGAGGWHPTASRFWSPIRSIVSPARRFILDFKFGDDKTTERMGEVRKLIISPEGTENDAHAFVEFPAPRA